MQKIERDHNGVRAPVAGMYRILCPECDGEGSTWMGHGSVVCQKCNGRRSVWERNKLAPLPTKRCPKCAGIGWVLPHTALEHCELCEGLGKVAQYD